MKRGEVGKMHPMGGWRYIRGSIFDSKAGRVCVVSDFGVYTDLKPPGLWGWGLTQKEVARPTLPLHSHQAGRQRFKVPSGEPSE